MHCTLSYVSVSESEDSCIWICGNSAQHQPVWYFMFFSSHDVGGEGGLELVSRFEFEFRRRGFFLKDSNFWCVQISITHTHHVAVNVHMLWLVCTDTIPFRMLWRPWRFMKQLWKVINIFMCADTYSVIHIHIHIHRHINWHIYRHTHIHIFILVEEREEGGDKSSHVTTDSLRSVPQDCWNWTALSGTANDWRNRQRVTLSTWSQAEEGWYPLVSCGESLVWANFGRSIQNVPCAL